MTIKIGSLSPRYIRVKEEDRQEIFMIDIVMTKEVIKIGIDQIVDIEFSGRIQNGQNYRDNPRYNQTIEMVLGEDTLKEM